MGDVAEAFHSFGVDRRLVDASGHEVEALTPLLARAEAVELRPALRGALDGRPAVVGHVSYGGGHAVGAESDATFEFIVVITRVPESAAFVPRLFCRSRGRVESVGGMGMSLDAEGLWTESDALGRRYEVATSPYQDRNWMLQLFSPDFIDWLVTTPPAGFAFELAYGDLVGSIPAAGVGADELAAVWDAAGEVAARLRKECGEEAVG
ncbi:MAG TPA: hypothetical protein VHF58_10470 [Solirubrobacterales bacterium]|nr:hypothetical protein [Solirubrobacterales bacterium]